MKSLIKGCIIKFFSFLRKNKIMSEYVKRRAEGAVRVLLYHDIEPHQLGNFANQLDYLARTHKFITPSEFKVHMSGLEPLSGRNLLVTFDDGFLSNKAAAEVLNQRNIKAIFFIISDFVSIVNPSDARDFIAKNIFPNIIKNEMPAHWANMGWGDVKYLVEKGHTIGGHTRSHANVSSITDYISLKNEIVDSATEIEAKIGASLEHFAFTFGNIDSFSSDALAVALCKYTWVHSGFRGFNKVDNEGYLVRRDAVSPDLSFDELEFYLGGFSDGYYKKDINTCLSWHTDNA